MPRWILEQGIRNQDGNLLYFLIVSVVLIPAARQIMSGFRGLMQWQLSHAVMLTFRQDLYR